jgi:hypothetical protein
VAEGQPLALELQVDPSLPPRGAVAIANRGTTPVRVWELGNSWGDATLSFELLRDGAVEKIVREPQVYTVNLPERREVPAGGRHEWRFDLGDGSWKIGDVTHLDVPDTRLVAVYEVVPTPEAEEHGVWVGRLRSDPVPLASR